MTFKEWLYPGNSPGKSGKNVPLRIKKEMRGLKLQGKAVKKAVADRSAKVGKMEKKLKNVKF